MAFVAVATSVGTAVGLGTGLAATIGGGALIGAGVGGLYSAVTGDGNILNSMLTGGLIGGAGAGLGSAMGLGAAGGAGGTGAAGGAAGATGTGSTLASQAAAPMATAVQTASPAAQAAAANAANLEALAVLEGGPQVGMLGAANTGLPAGTVMPTSMQFTPAVTEVAKTGAALTPKEMLGYGLAGSAALSLLGNKPTSAGSPPQPGMIRPYQYAANPTEATGEYPSPYATTQYNTAGLPILDTRERKYFSPSFTALPPYEAAKGGLMYAYGGPVERMSAMDQQRGMYPQGMIDKTAYATPTQRPASMEIVRSDYDTPVNPITGLQPMGMAMGGDVQYNLGSYSDGGRLLKGPGDGVSDDIPAMIGKKQPARLADGEFVIPARIVSELGNGSTDAGAKRLYAMMDRVQAKRQKSAKKGKFAINTKAEKELPA
jgi:hypothetical protein